LHVNIDVVDLDLVGPRRRRRTIIKPAIETEIEIDKIGITPPTVSCPDYT
jgi:hypothetical protein